MLESGGSMVLKLAWAPIGLMLLWTSGKNFFARPIRSWYIFLAGFSFYLLLEIAFRNLPFFGTDYINMMISMVICIISYAYWKKYGTSGKLKLISFSIACAAWALAYTIYTGSLVLIDITSASEIYTSKNSAAQIILAADLICLLCYAPANILEKGFKYVTVVFFTFVVFILKSRATIAALFFIVFYLVITTKKRWHKWAMATLIVAAVVYVFSNPDYYTLIVENILFNNRDSDDLNSLSSGRLQIIADIWDNYLKTPVFGIGNKYVDCFPFAMLIQFGIIGFLIVMAFIWDIWKKCYKIRNLSKLGLCAFLTYASFLVNSLFEAQAPFGPGVKCCVLWVVVGFAFAHYSKYLGCHQPCPSLKNDNLL